MFDIGQELKELVIKRSRRESKKVDQIFPRYKQNSLDKIEESLFHAQGRWNPKSGGMDIHGDVHESQQGAAGPNNPIRTREGSIEKGAGSESENKTAKKQNRAYASKCFTIPKPDNDYKPSPQNEGSPHDEVNVFIKIGNRKWEVMYDKATGESNAPEMTIPAGRNGVNVINVLNKAKEFVSGLEPHSIDGKAFHEVAITQARPPVDKGGMNPKSDSYEANYSPLYKYDADLDKYVETEKGVKERSLRELRRENE